MPANGTPPDGTSPKARSGGFIPSTGQVLRILTATSNVSAAVFSVFVAVHLTSPIAAAIGGVNLADKTLLIGRDLYLPLEPVLIYAPLIIHISASGIKRAILTYRTKRLPQLTIHLVTGYLLVPLILPHILVHRILPQSPAPPISSLSPSELGFDFVAYSMFSRPIESTLAYMGLVGLMVPHAVLGSMKVVSWLRRVAGGTEKAVVAESPKRTGVPRNRKFMAGAAYVGLLGVVATGLLRLYREGSGVAGFIGKRYEAVLAQTSFT